MTDEIAELRAKLLHNAEGEITEAEIAEGRRLLAEATPGAEGTLIAFLMRNAPSLLASASRVAELEGERDRLREALERIATEKGVCGNCGTPTTGLGTGITNDCCERPVWYRADPKTIARAALAGAKP